MMSIIITKHEHKMEHNDGLVRNKRQRDKEEEENRQLIIENMSSTVYSSSSDESELFETRNI